MSKLLSIDVTTKEAEQIEKLLFNRIELVKLLDDITNKSDKITIQVKSAKHQGSVDRVFPVLESVREAVLAAAINELDNQLALLGINIIDRVK